ncbi:Flagellar hook-associated protein FlgL [hydrothermal vent metagenome]|uniref:Flagellar hook-associated protein FlgL n=1 Tax=hydrothermal vent metagenome TaxID=652676 RepID=A0A3B0TS50_9ZZZZ
MVSVFGVGRPSALPTSVSSLSRELGNLQIQLGTGRKSQSYSGLGSSRTLALDLRSQIAKIDGYQRTIQTVSLRLEVAQQSLTRMDAILAETRSSLSLTAYEVGGNGQTLAQYGAQEKAQEIVSLLNSKVNESYMFAGRDSDKVPVVGIDKILDGDGARDGLRTFLTERLAADTGSDGFGRLTIPAASAGALTFSEDGAGHPFGLKLNAVTSDLTGTAISGPSGSPTEISVTFSATQPVAGEAITFTFDLPDGTTETLKLTATTTVPPDEGQFLIGANETETGDNFRAVLAARITTLVATAGAAASAAQAGLEFFEFDAANPPQRVNGPPFESATSLVDATASDTVFWYKGEIETANPRNAVTARIDDGYTLKYGLRANEEALRDGLKFTALLAVLKFDASVETDAQKYAEVKERLTPGFLTSGGQASVREIATEVALKQQVLGAAGARHLTAISLTQSTLDETEGVDLNEVGAKLLALQTHLQASYEATSLLSRLSLVNFL